MADGDHSHSSHRGKKEGNCNDLKMRKMITDVRKGHSPSFQIIFDALREKRFALLS